MNRNVILSSYDSVMLPHVSIATENEFESPVKSDFAAANGRSDDMLDSNGDDIAFCFLTCGHNSRNNSRNSSSSNELVIQRVNIMQLAQCMSLHSTLTAADAGISHSQHKRVYVSYLRTMAHYVTYCVAVQSDMLHWATRFMSARRTKRSKCGQVTI